MSDHEALRRLRKNKGHSGRTLSMESGVSQSRISELEAASIPVRSMTAKLLADALGVEILDIAYVVKDEEVAG